MLTKIVTMLQWIKPSYNTDGSVWLLSVFVAWYILKNVLALQYEIQICSKHWAMVIWINQRGEQDCDNFAWSDLKKEIRGNIQCFETTEIAKFVDM